MIRHNTAGWLFRQRVREHDNDEARMTNGEGITMTRSSRVRLLGTSRLAAPPDFREDKMKFPRFHPDFTCCRLQLRCGAHRHSKKMLRLARFLSTSANALEEF